MEERDRFARCDGSLEISPNWGARIGPYLLLIAAPVAHLIDPQIRFSAAFFMVFLLCAVVSVTMIAGGFGTRVLATDEGLQVRVPIRGSLNLQWGEIEQLVLHPMPSAGIKFEFTVKVMDSDQLPRKYSVSLGIAEALAAGDALAEFANAHGARAVVDKT